MGEFEIEAAKIAGMADQISGYSIQLKRQKAQVEDISRKLMFSKDYQDVERALTWTAARMKLQQEQLRQYGGMLESIVRAYRDTEKKICSSDLY